MKRMNVMRIVVIATLLAVFVATSMGTSFAATKSNVSQNYTLPAQSTMAYPQPEGSAANTNTAGFANATNGVGAVLQGVGATLVGAAALLAALSSSSSSGIVQHLGSNVSPSVKSAFGR